MPASTAEPDRHTGHRTSRSRTAGLIVALLTCALVVASCGGIARNAAPGPQQSAQATPSDLSDVSITPQSTESTIPALADDNTTRDTTKRSRKTEFAVGDCVRILRTDLGVILKPERCATARGTMDEAKRIYKVNSIIPITDGCPQFSGFFPVELAADAEGVNYCLVMATGG